MFSGAGSRRLKFLGFCISKEQLPISNIYIRYMFNTEFNIASGIPVMKLYEIIWYIFINHKCDYYNYFIMLCLVNGGNSNKNQNRLRLT